MATETINNQSVLDTQVNHIASKDKMEQMKNLTSSNIKYNEVAALATKLENLAQNTPLRFSSEAMRPPTKNNSRFGNFSQHSFFSRHNPHPHRVTHIQGLNGNPVCTVNDEWSVTSPLFPHPMIKSQLPTNMFGVSCSMPIGDPHGNKAPFLAAGFVSEAWREELKELAAKVCTSDKQPVSKEVEEPRRSTQYSAETGRIIPPSSRAMTRQGSRKANRNSINKSKNSAAIFQDQELLILELLSQILQTDSLTAIQQWLLSAGQKEKDLVMSMIQTATANMQPDSQTFGKSLGDRLHSQAGLGLLSRDEYHQMKNMNRSGNKEKEEPISEEDKPEHIGAAEVLQIYPSGNEHQSKTGSAE